MLSSEIINALGCSEALATDLIICKAVNSRMKVKDGDFIGTQYRDRLTKKLNKSDTLSGHSWASLIDLTMDFRRWLDFKDLGNLGGYDHNAALQGIIQKYNAIIVPTTHN